MIPTADTHSLSPQVEVELSERVAAKYISCVNVVCQVEPRPRIGHTEIVGGGWERGISRDTSHPSLWRYQCGKSAGRGFAGDRRLQGGLVRFVQCRIELRPSFS